MGIVQNIIGMVRDIHDRQRAVKIDDAKKNYLLDPNSAIQAVNTVSGDAGIALNNQHIAEQAAAEAATRARAGADLGAFRQSLRGMPAGTDYGSTIDQMAPTLTAQGVSPEHLATFKAGVAANPGMLMDDKAYENWSKDQTSNTVAPIGSHVIRAGQVIDKVPFAAKTTTTPAGATSSIFDPNANDGHGAFVTGGGGGGPAAPGAGVGGGLTVDRLRPLFVAQESGGDYTARNAETGAMGKYQIMPDTGRGLASKVGLPWRPDMMRKDDAQSRAYQDKLGDAAIQESIDYGGGDPAKTFSHYYGGSNTNHWGPKTRKYTSDMMGRLGQGGAEGAPAGGPVITPTSVSSPAKPVAARPTTRPLTPEEVAQRGFAPGTVAQIDSTGKTTVLDKVPAAIRPKPFDLDKARTASDTLTQLNGFASELLGLPGLSAAGGNIQGRLPDMLIGQAGTTFRNKLKAMKSNIGLSKLMEFKAGSSQGASGFGNLSNEEGARLEQAYGSLDDTSDDDTRRKAIQTIVDTTNRASERIRWQMSRAQAGLGHDVPPVGTVKDGHRFIGGSPESPANWIPVRGARK